MSLKDLCLEVIREKLANEQLPENWINGNREITPFSQLPTEQVQLLLMRSTPMPLSHLLLFQDCLATSVDFTGAFNVNDRDPTFSILFQHLYYFFPCLTHLKLRNALVSDYGLAHLSYLHKYEE